MMKMFYFVSVVLFLSGLSLLIQADEAPKATTIPDVQPLNQADDIGEMGRIEMSEAEQKNILGKVIKLTGVAVTAFTKNGTITDGPYIGEPKVVPFKDTILGVVQIFDSTSAQKPLCTGSLLKGWIVLTAASCIYNHSPDDLFVEVTYSLKPGEYLKRRVAVDNYDIEPNYKFPEVAYDLALMVIYTNYEWDVNEFELPSYEITVKEISEKGLYTSAVLWKPRPDILDPEGDYMAIAVKETPVADFSPCGQLFNSLDNWYCAKVDEGAVSMNNGDVGHPLYYTGGPLRRLFAVYTGWNLNQILGGHVYLSIFPSIDWIENFIYQNNLPPFRYLI